MENKIRIGICGYGNLGKGVEQAIKQAPDMELKVIFTRRNPQELAKTTVTPVVAIQEAEQWEKKLDVVILCGGSKDDIPKQMPEFASKFNTINTFDTHADIPMLYTKTEEIAKKAGKLSLISTGWDPGLFSLIRVLAKSIFTEAKLYTVWGTGVSQGHSDAIRQIEGVKNAIQYTVPIEERIEQIRNGEEVEYTASQLHKRECYVAANKEDYAQIEKEIKEMPKYFADYETTVTFVTEEEIKEKQTKMFHGGSVICVGKTPAGNKQVMEFKLTLDSNPEFTGSVATMYARAITRLNKKGETGARLVTEIPFQDILPEEENEKFQYI